MNLPPNVDWPDSRHSPCSALRQWCVGAAANNFSAWRDRVITSVVWEARSLRGIWEAERQCSLKPEDQEAFESSRSLPALPSLELCIIFWRRYFELRGPLLCGVSATELISLVRSLLPSDAQENLISPPGCWRPGVSSLLRTMSQCNSRRDVSTKHASCMRY